MIEPVNNHILIEPLKHESFISSQKETYEEVGIVIAIPGEARHYCKEDIFNYLKKGDKVFFDSWLAAKYPTGKGDDFFWLVKWEDVRAIESKDEISK